MEDSAKTKEELLKEIKELHRRINKISCTRIYDSEGILDGLECLEFYQSVIAAIREPILVLNSDLKCIFSNNSFNQSFNIAPSEIRNESVFTVADGVLDKPELRKLIEELLSIHMEMDDYEVNLDLIQVGSRYLSLKATDVHRSKDSNRMILLSFEDTTDRLKAEKKQHDEEVRYRTLFEASRDAIMLLAPPDWNFTAGNPATIQMFRCKDELDFTSRRPWELSPEYQQDDQLSAIKAKDMILKAVDAGSNLFEWIHKRADGEEFPATVLLSRIELKGQVLLQATVRDITERKKFEEELRKHQFNLEEIVRERTVELQESEEKYRTLVEQSRDGIYIYGGKRFLFVNDMVCRITGYSREELYSTEFMELIHHDDVQMYLDYASRRQEGQEVPEVYQARIVTKDGAVKHMEFAVRDITYKGDYAVLGIGRDITSLKKVEEEQSRIEKLESLGILAGGIAHDFNNFLTAVMGNISLARTMVEPGSDIYEILTSSEHAASKASGLTRQLLTFSQGGEPVKTRISVAELIRESTRFVLSGSNVTADLDLAPNLCTVIADKEQLAQVINNLLINANQAMPEGGRIFISAFNTDLESESSIPLEAGRYIRIEIRDEGTGISKKQLFRIFDPFFSTKQTGSGLGLATAFSIVSKHSGHITVESELGKGSTFIVYLPADIIAGEVEQYAMEPLSDIGANILIMDDKEMVLETAASMLEHLGNRVVCTTNGDEVLTEYRKSIESGDPFDAVILDLTIPDGMGGRETIKELLKINPDVKAIVSSGYSNDPVMADYMNHGFKGVMLKPYSLLQLSSILQEILEQKS